MSDKRFDVFGVGNAIVDTLAFVDDDFVREHDLKKGAMTLVDSEKQASLLHALDSQKLELRSGGSAANTMIGVALSGGTGYYAGKVARDPNGEFYRQDLLDSGIHFDVHPEDEKELPTGTCLVFTTPDAERTMYTHLGVSVELAGIDIDEEKLKDSKIAYLEGYLWSGPSTKDAALQTFKLAKKHGVKIAYSYSDPFMVDLFRDDFRQITQDYLDIVFCNAEEAKHFAGKEDVHEAAREIGSMVELAFITNGSKGAIVIEGGNLTEVPGFSVNAIDTNGAGDAFAAGTLFGLTRGFDSLKSARWGNYLASEVVQVAGARIHGSRADRVSEILGS